MKILVLGAGAIGGYYGARLIEAGADVTFLVRDGRMKQLNDNGLQVMSSLGDFGESVRAVRAVDGSEAFDLVVLACKAYDLSASVEAVAPAMASGASVLPFLNGLGAYDYLDGSFGRRRVLGGVAYIASTLTSDGIVRHLGDGDSVIVGPRAAEAGDIAREVHALIGRTPGKMALSANTDQALWDKWVLLSAGAAICCLMRGTVGQIMRTDSGSALMIQAIDECARVATASGFPIRSDRLEATRTFLLDQDSDWAASMMRDMARNHPEIEHEAIVGDMLDYAARLGVTTPLMNTAYPHLQVYAAARDRQPLASHSP